MRVEKRIPWLFSLGVVLAALALCWTRAGADVTSDRPGSVVIWPKVIADGTRDTIISLTNTSNLQVFAHCEYILGTGACSLTPEYCSRPATFTGGGSPDCTQIMGGPANQCEITWQTGDFDVILTRQQPTFWRVSTGRVEDLLLMQTDPVSCDEYSDGGTLREKCPGLFSVGNVPIPPQAGIVGSGPDDPTFRGELRCIQVNEDGSPNTANALKGEATIETLGTNQISEYNAINVIGNVTPEDSPLELNGVSYNACPESVEFTHYAPNASDLVAEDLGATCTVSGCPVRTEITLVPCRSEFLDPSFPGTGIGTEFNAFFAVWDEFEQFFSLHPRFDCWSNLDLQQLGYSNLHSSTFQHTRITSEGSGLCISGPNEGFIGCTNDAACGAGGVCGPISGVLAVVEQFHENDTSTPPPGPPKYPGPALINVGTDAANAYSFDANGDGSLQRLGSCRTKTTQKCSEDGDCPTGLCRLATTTPCESNVDCTTTNADCTAANVPADCCTAAGTGTCSPVANDFCDRCMNDEIFYDQASVMPQP